VVRNEDHNLKPLQIMERQKKRLYHSELVEMGEVTVDITSDVRVSKFGNRNKYV